MQNKKTKKKYTHIKIYMHICMYTFVYVKICAYLYAYYIQYLFTLHILAFYSKVMNISKTKCKKPRKTKVEVSQTLSKVLFLTKQETKKRLNKKKIK